MTTANVSAKIKSSPPKHQYDIYVSGKMTGVENYNRERFNEVSEKLRNDGFAVFNPGEIIGRDDWSWSDYMRVSLTGMLASRALYVLDGYETSKGANIEIELAKNLDMHIIYENDTSINPLPQPDLHDIGAQKLKEMTYRILFVKFERNANSTYVNVLLDGCHLSSFYSDAQTKEQFEKHCLAFTMTEEYKSAINNK